MEPSVEIYESSRLYVRFGWAAVGGTAVCGLCGFETPFAFIPGGLCGITAALAFWLGCRPRIRIGADRLNIGERAIAWREIREINTTRFTSPLVLKLRLTNARRRLLIFPGKPESIAHLLFQLRKLATLASFDSVAYRDYWTWNTIKELSGDGEVNTPARMVSQEDEEEIERMFQRLKGDGSLSSHNGDSKAESEP